MALVGPPADFAQSAFLCSCCACAGAVIVFAPERLLCSRPSSEVLIGKPGGVLFESGIVHNKWNAPVTSVRQTSTATVILVTPTLTVILVTPTLTASPR